MNVITRFAPSPTGLLHIGSVRTALICYLYAKKLGGQFMLRFDDTDTERSKQEYTDAIINDLKWLGLNWDIETKQSERFEKYEQAKQKLIADGRLYPCFESAEEIEVKRKMQLSRGKPPIYDRAALELTNEQIKQFQDEGKNPHWRFKLDHNSEIRWKDNIKGEVHFEASNLSDPVLIRENGTPTYMLPSTIDDIDFNISHVIRGEDHVSNTAIQIQLFEAMSATPPEFAHHSLMKGKDGKISKRKGGYDLESMRQKGIEPISILSLMARIGTSDPVEAKNSIDEIIENFDIKRFSKSAAIYEYEELERLNSKVIHNLSFEHVKSRDSMQNIDKNFWNSVKANLNSVNEIQEWWQICKEEINADNQDKEFLITASKLLPDGNWDENTWSNWVNAIKQSTNRSGKDLFMPLRIALTGKSNGPELKILLPLIGRKKTLERLSS